MLGVAPVRSSADQRTARAAEARARAVRVTERSRAVGGGEAIDEGTRRRPGRLAAGILVVLATVALLVGSFAVWVERQALNTDNWTKASAQVLANPKVQKAVSAYLVSELFTSVNVAGELRAVLPDQLAASVAAELQQVADRAALTLLAEPSVQDAWRSANRAAHRELLQLLDGGDRAVGTRGGVVTLNLHPLVAELARAIGTQSLIAALPSGLQDLFGTERRAAAQRRLGVIAPAPSGRLVIMRSSQLETAQNVVEGIRGLATVLPLAALAMFGLAVLVARGWRRIVLRRIGWCFIGIGVGVLVARRVLEPRLVDALVSSPSARPAADVAWTIGTSLLRDIAIVLIAYGAVIVAAAWLAGRTRPARRLRAMMAFTLRERPLLAYGSLGLAIFLLALWGPTEALRQPLPVLGITALLAVGLEAIRRQAAREFPQARAGDAGRVLTGRLSV